MRTTLFALAVAVSTFTGVLGRAANNAAQANVINRQSVVLPPGKYKFKNVKTGQWMHYEQSNQQIYPSGSPSWMNVKGHEKHVVISPSSSNDKCWSAQWDAKYEGGSDWAVALYECDVKTNRKRDEVEERSTEALEERDEATDIEKRWSRQGRVRSAKQYWYIHGADRKNTWHIVTSDHIYDMKTRAVESCTKTARYNKRSKLTCLDVKNDKNTAQMWYIYNSHGKMVTN